MTYNGRGFDWPLLTTRYRMARRAAPAHAGHLDLLPIVRRLFRHRMADARLRTAEAELLGMHRIGDVDGWEIPGRYLELPARRRRPASWPRSSATTTRTSARSAGCSRYLETGYGDRRSAAERAAGRPRRARPARSRASGGCDEALDCLDAAVDRPASRRRIRPDRPSLRVAPARGRRAAAPDEPWWSPRRPAGLRRPTGAPVEPRGPPRDRAVRRALDIGADR